MWLVN
jgi:hypothetical protein